jgi:hypothetical protein
MKPPKDKMFIDNRARTAVLKANVKAQQSLFADSSGIEYFQLVGDPSLNEKTALVPVDRQNIDISRGTTELKGFYPFLFFSLPWICTHLGDFIEEAGDDYYYINLTWEQYLEITLDKYTGLGDILQRELNRFRHENANHTYKLINIDKHRIISMIPFIINIIYDDGSIDDLTKVRLKTLKKRFNVSEIHKISEIHIYFSKYLFKPYKENAKNYKNLPKAIWAMALWNELQNEKIFKKHFEPIKRLIVVGNTEKTRSNIDTYADENPEIKKILPLYSQELRVLVTGGELVSRHSREYLSSYINFYLYLLGKDNGRGDYISINPLDLFLHVIPGMIDAISRHDTQKKEYYLRILKGAVAALDDWTGLDFTIEKFTETNGPKMRFYIDRNYLPKQYKGKKRKDKKTQRKKPST